MSKESNYSRKNDIESIEKTAQEEIETLTNNTSLTQTDEQSQMLESNIGEEKNTDTSVTDIISQTKEELAANNTVNTNINTNASEQQQLNNNQELKLEPTKERKKKGPVFTVIISLLALLFVMIVFYSLYFTPDRIFKKTIDKLSEYALETIERTTEMFIKDYNTVAANYSYEYSVNYGIKKVSSKINGKAGIDKSKELIYLSFDGKNYITGEYSGIMLIDNSNKLYLSTDNNFDNGYYIDLSNEESSINISTETFDKTTGMAKNVSYITKKTMDSFKNSYDTSKIEKSMELKNINDKKILTTKLTDTISAKEVLEIKNKMIDFLKKDDKFLESFSYILSIYTKNDYEKDKAKEILEYLKENSSYDGKSINLVLNYTLTGKLVYAELSGEDYKIYLEQDDGIYTITKEEKGYYSDTDKTEYIYNTKDRTLTIKSDETKVTISYEIDKVSDKEYKYDVNVKLKDGEINMSYGINVTTKLDGKLETFDTSNCKDVNTMTDAEQETFSESLIKIFPSLYTVTKSFRSTQKQAFIIELENIMHDATYKVIYEDILDDINSTVTYSNISTCEAIDEAVDDDNDINYSITLDKEGNILSFNASNGKFSYQITNPEEKDYYDIDIDIEDIQHGNNYVEATCTK